MWYICRIYYKELALSVTETGESQSAVCKLRSQESQCYSTKNEKAGNTRSRSQGQRLYLRPHQLDTEWIPSPSLFYSPPSKWGTPSHAEEDQLASSVQEFKCWPISSGNTPIALPEIMFNLGTPCPQQVDTQNKLSTEVALLPCPECNLENGTETFSLVAYRHAQPYRSKHTFNSQSNWRNRSQPSAKRHISQDWSPQNGRGKL